MGRDAGADAGLHVFSPPHSSGGFTACREEDTFLRRDQDAPLEINDGGGVMMTTHTFLNNSLLFISSAGGQKVMKEFKAAQQVFPKRPELLGFFSMKTLMLHEQLCWIQVFLQMVSMETSLLNPIKRFKVPPCDLPPKVSPAEAPTHTSGGPLHRTLRSYANIYGINTPLRASQRYQVLLIFCHCVPLLQSMDRKYS